MPSQENLNVKKQIVAEIKEKFENAKSAVVVDYRGITVEEADAMRKQLRESGVDYTVYKNKLVTKAIAGTPFEEMTEILKGTNAFAFSNEDAVAPARVLNGVIKNIKKMEFRGGFVEGTYYDAKGIEAIASLPGREELIAKFLGSIQSPVSKLARTFQAIADAKEA